MNPGLWILIIYGAIAITGWSIVGMYFAVRTITRRRKLTRMIQPYAAVGANEAQAFANSTKICKCGCKRFISAGDKHA